jgi:hypothetical protein
VFVNLGVSTEPPFVNPKRSQQSVFPEGTNSQHRPAQGAPCSPISQASDKLSLSRETEITVFGEDYQQPADHEMITQSRRIPEWLIAQQVWPSASNPHPSAMQTHDTKGRCLTVQAIFPMFEYQSSCPANPSQTSTSCLTADTTMVRYRKRQSSQPRGVFAGAERRSNPLDDTQSLTTTRAHFTAQFASPPRKTSQKSSLLKAMGTRFRAPSGWKFDYWNASKLFASPSESELQLSCSVSESHGYTAHSHSFISLHIVGNVLCLSVL